MLALAHMVMSAKLPVRLRVLVPSVENSVDAVSYRNGDIIRARNGLTTEVITTGKTQEMMRYIYRMYIVSAHLPRLRLVHPQGWREPPNFATYE